MQPLDFETIYCHLKQDKPFAIKDNSITILGLYGKIKEYTSSQLHKERIERIATIFTDHLEKDVFSSMEDVENNPKVKCVKKFLRNLKKKERKYPTVQKLQKLLTAKRLLLPLEALEKNHSFYQFAKQHHLHHYLRHYEHQLNYHEDTIQIMKEGEYKDWEEVSEIANWKPIPKNKQPTQPWVYGHKGLQKKDLYDWTELTPYKIEKDHKWGNRWIFEVRTCNEESPQKTGNHAWMRLKNPDGEIFSFGLYRPEKAGIKDNFKAPLRIKKGHLMQPDYSDVYPCTIHSFEYEIDEPLFNKIKDQVEKDKQSDVEHFHPIGMNCTRYVKKIAKIAGLKLKAKKKLWRLITPSKLERVVDKIGNYTPSLIKKVSNYIMALFMNTLQVLLGATLNDKQIVKSSGEAVPPHIRLFSWDFFKPSKATINHPHTLGILCDRIRTWQQENQPYQVPLKCKQVIH